jgi:hypothetical protein
MAHRVSLNVGVMLASAILAFPHGSFEAATRPAVPDALVAGFLNPPSSAKPRVWWHWMSGNITQEGIRLDLEWMHRVGIGGVQNFDAAYGTPQLIDQRLAFMSQPWQSAFRLAATLADQLGLELAIGGSPGWSESGGPWVKPEEAMKKLVWSEIRIQGGSPFAGKLPRPPNVVGPFQNVPITDRSVDSYAGPAPVDAIPNLYQDVAVLACRLADDDYSMVELHPVVTSSAGLIEAKALWDGDLARAIHLPYGRDGEPAWIQIDFGRPQTIHAMSVGLADVSMTPESRYFGAELEASADGKTFDRVAAVYDTAEHSIAGIPPLEDTVTFHPVSARYFRLQLPTPPPPSEMWATFLPPKPREHHVTQWVLYTTPKVDHFEYKAGYFLEAGLESHATPRITAREAIDPREIIDLTAKLQPDGTLNWTPPKGRWSILRLGFSLLGITNHPASPEGTGLEVDKLSGSAVKAYMDHYLARYESILGPQLMGSHGLQAMINDSYEAGSQNWTNELPSEFARRRGYELKPWLLALTGRVIGSAETTDRFLWDFRRTLGELIAENHYRQITDSLHERGLIHYGESHESYRAFIGDGMDAKRSDDIPMGAMWTPGSVFATPEQGDADIRESASVAHIYGQNRVAAESMTAFGTSSTAYSFAPENLKPTVDRELADGLNLFVVHTSVHQPLNNAGPGVTLGLFGQWFTRHETWAEQATPWVSYLARSSYLLQQGHFVADILYFYGQDSNITALYGTHLPPIPDGYAFDFANAHALTMLSVREGDLVTASGMHYRLLALDPRVRVLSLDVLKTIAQLVGAGATVVGDKPIATPSLADNEVEFHALTDALWGDGATGDHRYGAGRILAGKSLSDAVVQLQLTPDFTYSSHYGNSTVWYAHRHLEDGELYFVNNRQDRAEQIEARFRVNGRAPELWHADTGVIEPASYRQEDHQTIVPLHLDPHDALFVVFRKPAQQHERDVAESIRKPLVVISGPWEVHFQTKRGAPERATFTDLRSWSTDADAGIRYFSGTASYETIFRAQASWLVKGRRVEIDLGAVKNLAEVIVNGKSAGIVWKAPFRADITRLLQIGMNQLTVRATNLWPNRLIGDKQPTLVPVTSTTFNPYDANSPLLESGLLGPVTLHSVTLAASQ